MSPARWRASSTARWTVPWCSLHQRSARACAGTGGRRTRHRTPWWANGPGHRRYRRYRPGDGPTFAGLGATVHVLGRNPKVRRTVAGIPRRFRVPEVIGEVCDVSDLDAVAAWTTEFGNRVPALDGLVHNAG